MKLPTAMDVQRILPFRQRRMVGKINSRKHQFYYFVDSMPKSIVSLGSDYELNLPLVG